MSLIICPDCGKVVRYKAIRCPNCDALLHDKMETKRLRSMRRRRKTTVRFVLTLFAAILITAASCYYFFVQRDKSAYHFSENEQKLITAAQCLQNNLYFPETIRIYDAVLRPSSEDSSYEILANYSALTLGNTYNNELVYIRVEGNEYDIQRDTSDSSSNEEKANSLGYALAMFSAMNASDEWVQFEDFSNINEYLQCVKPPTNYIEMPDEY